MPLYPTTGTATATIVTSSAAIDAAAVTAAASQTSQV